MQNRVLKIRDNKSMVFMMFAFGILPLVFMIISAILNNDYLIGFFVTLIIYTAFFAWFLRDLKKKENDYAIIADSESVTFKNIGSYRWHEIASIQTLRRYSLSSSYEVKYLRINFVSKPSCIINASSYDLTIEEIASELRLIGGLN